MTKNRIKYYGKFVHIVDVEGNKVQLWEPTDD
jgi:predicted enzyme related to lactoylglutathione lyase